VAKHRTTTDITFRVIQIGKDIKNGEIVGVRETVGEFPATIHGVRKALTSSQRFLFASAARKVIRQALPTWPDSDFC